MILITGATGQVGSRVLGRLAGAGHAVRALSRTPERTDWPADVEVVRGDLADPATLPAALAGVDAVFLFAAPGCGPAFAAAAREAGVRKVVLLSSGAVADEGAQDGPIAAYHAEIEAALRGSGLAWTFLRPDVFAANSLMWAGQTRAGDVIRGAYAGASSAPVHEADIADAAVAALLDAVHVGQVHRLTGPESLTHAEQARILGDALGRPVVFEELPAEVARQAMSAYVPPPILDGILGHWAASVGRTAVTTADVEKVTGHPARTYREWASDHAAEF
jgi:uncharacterized protein YbjT (DUF2867 family)